MHRIVFAALAEAARAKEPVALAVITGAKGSSPQKVGAKAVFYADGRIKGTMGGGCLEAEIQQRAIQSLRTGKPATFDLVLDHDFGWDDGLICGGKVVGAIVPNAQDAGEQLWSALTERKRELTWGIAQELAIEAESDPGEEWLYRETVSPPCALWVAGAGHIAQAVAPLAVQLDFATTVFDDRPALAAPQCFPASVRIECEVWEKLLAAPLPEAPTFGVIVTRGHRHDAAVLKEWISKPFLFIGMIGSRRKARIIFDHFLQEKIASRQDLERVACPVGIPFRSRTVPEIAVSIMAQFIDKRAELVYERRGLTNRPNGNPSGTFPKYARPC